MKLRQEQLKQHLRNNLAPIYLISGDEPFLIQESRDIIRDHVYANGFSERNYLSANKNFNWQSLTIVANNLSLFSEKTLIELNIPNAKPGDAGSKTLQAYAQNPPADKILLITTSRLDSAAQKSRWFKAIESAGIFIPIWPMDAAKLPSWIAQRMQQNGLKTSPEGIKLLTEYVEGNLLAAAQEIEKLRLLYGTGTLDIQQIAVAIADNSRFNIFDFVDTVFKGNGKKIIHILSCLKNEKIEPALILWALTRELRSLAALKHESNAISKMLQQCAKIDRIIKGVEPGNIWDELERLCINQSAY